MQLIVWHKSPFLKEGQTPKWQYWGKGWTYHFERSCFIRLLYLFAYGVFLFLFPWKEMIEEEKRPTHFCVRIPDFPCFDRNHWEIIISSSRGITPSEIMNSFFLYRCVCLYWVTFFFKHSSSKMSAFCDPRPVTVQTLHTPPVPFVPETWMSFSVVCHCKWEKRVVYLCSPRPVHAVRTVNTVRIKPLYA